MTTNALALIMTLFVMYPVYSHVLNMLMNMKSITKIQISEPIFGRGLRFYKEYLMKPFRQRISQILAS